MRNEIRRLHETYFKYPNGLIELHDRLTFLAAQKSEDLSICLQSSKILYRSPVSITDEITELLNLRKQRS